MKATAASADSSNGRALRGAFRDKQAMCFPQNGNRTIFTAVLRRNWGYFTKKVQIVSRCHVFRHPAADPPSLACEGMMRETKRPDRTMSGAGHSNGDETWRGRASTN